MDFGILGPLEIWTGNPDAELRGAKPRALLALLLLQTQAFVSAERLVDELWEGSPPPSAPKTLQTYVHHIRRRIGGDLLVTRPGGYMLAVDPDRIDAGRFERITRGVAEDPGRDPEQTATDLREALGLWRGEPLVEFADTPWAHGEVARLSGLQLWATEARVDAELALGRHAALLPELESLVDDYPLRERFWGQLMLALYRSGRQAEALRAYRRLHTLLDEELGIRPSTDLVLLEQSMLLQESALDLPPAPRVSAGTDDSETGNVSTGARPGVGRLLPLALQVQLDSPFVGRDLEVDRYLPIDPGASRGLLLAGEAGIGKTRLAAEIGRRAADSGTPVLYGRCQRALAVPYEPWVEALRGLAASVPSAQWENWVEDRPALARLLPELVPGARLLPDADPDGERYRLFEAVADLLADAARVRGRGAVVVLDDLHWADEPSLLLLSHVLTVARPHHLLVVATYRDTDLLGTNVLLDVLADLRRHDNLEWVTLPGLEEHEVSELITALTHETDIAKLARSVRDETDGNPFFVVEIVRHLSETGGVTVPDDAPGDVRDLPLSIREVVTQRVRTLGVDVNEILSTAAIVGAEFELELLAHVLARPADVLADPLDVATRARILREVAPGRYAFAHHLVQQTLVGDVSATRRQALHRRVAAALEGDGEHAEVHAGRIADHLLRANPASPDPRVLDFMQLAGDRALAHLAPQDACRWFTEALRVAELLPDVEETATVTLTVSLGAAQRQAGDPDHRATLLDAAERARAIGDRDLLVEAALANTRGWASAAGQVDGARLTVLEAAISAAGAGDSAARARLLATFAAELTWDGDWRRRRGLSDEALAMARRVGDLGTLAYVLTRRPNTIWVPDALGERLANTEESLAIARRLDDPVATFWASMYRLAATTAAAELAEAELHLRTMEEIAAAMPLPVLTWEAHLHRGWHQLLCGRFDDAEASASQAFTIGSESGQPDATLLYAGQLLMIRFDQGSVGEIEHVIEQQAVDNPGIPGFRAALALANCDTGRMDDAAHLLRRAAAEHFTDLPYDQLWLMSIGIWAFVATTVEDADAADSLYRLMLPWSGQVLSTGAHVFGASDHWLGALAIVTGDLDAADTHLRRAREVHARLHAPVWSLRTQLARALLLRRQGKPAAVSEAALLAAEAQTVAARLECRGLERAAGRLLA